MATDPMLALLEAARLHYCNPIVPHDAVDEALLAARSAGYPARREKELAVIEAAAREERKHAKRARRSKCVCALCLASRALDATTPKEPTDG